LHLWIRPSSLVFMRRFDLITLLSVGAAVGCAGDSEPPTRPPLLDPLPSGLVLQAVDAGTGSTLTDREMTVRYLVRAPITLDAFALDRTDSAEPYRIEHPIGEDSLVVEVRLEAESYHPLDTVLAVARGGSAGPYTLRMARRLERRPTRPANRPANTPAAAQPTEADPDARTNRNALRAGNRAFQNGDWASATLSYLQMPAPISRTGNYAEEYREARVRQGISHINLGEWAGALDALEEAVTFDDPGYLAYLRLGQAQCAVGRVATGRATLDQVEPLIADRPRRESVVVQGLTEYFRGLCTYGEFGNAERPGDLVRLGGQAIREFESTIQRAESLSPRPANLEAARVDSQAKIQEIRGRIRRGG